MSTVAIPVGSRVYDTLILSDLHLGADMSRAREALRVLRETSYRRLILLGDIFADLNFGRLKKEHWKFLGFIRKLSNPKRQVEVVWVEGNHDLGLAEIMSHLVGVEVYQEYQWDYRGIRHVAVHGHQFDRFVVKNVRLNYWFGTLLYLQLQKLDSKNKVLTRFLDRLGTRWQRLSEKVADGALSHAARVGATRIFCGHTHAALCRQRDGCEYYNSGAWIDEKLTYITVGDDGVQIHEYLQPPDVGHEGQDAEREAHEIAPAWVDEHEDGAVVGSDDFDDSNFVNRELVEDGEYQKVGD
ncbi:MAG TPA: UDP-2,3-diacylglucosamine diphosphatase [Terriglobales bacterium]|nr:UDP-2,3-diacylglucosamine diphosphatase [Terriglobales bacterium]